MPTKLFIEPLARDFREAEELCGIPGQVQVWSAIEIQLVLQHLVNGICGSSVLGYHEFGDLLFAGVAGGVWGDVRGTAFGVDMSPARLFHMEIVKTLDDLFGVDLWTRLVYALIIGPKLQALGGKVAAEHSLHGVRETFWRNWLKVDMVLVDWRYSL